MATKKLMLNRARRMNDGTYPLVMQLLHLRRKRVIYAKLHLHPNEFNQKSGTVVACKAKYRKGKEIKALNRAVREFCEVIEEIIGQYDETGLPYTVDDIVRKYQQRKLGGSLCLFWEEHITALQRAGQHGTADAYRSTLRSVVRFHGAAELSFSQITTAFITRYQAYLASTGVSPNTIAYYMRNFKALLNSAIKEKAMPAPKTNLFDGIDVRPQKTVKRALTREQLKALAEMTFEDDPEQELARDLFLFSFYTRGMAFVDIAFLRKEKIKDNAIHYFRRKTKQPLQISINEPAGRLIAKYSSVSHYLFPLVSSDDDRTAYKEYRTALRIININLKAIGERAGIQVPLTTYVARHSWATQAKERGASTAIISEGLGHTSEQVTRIYLKEFDQSVLDQINDEVSDL